MIKKALFTTLVLLVAHGLFVRLAQPDWSKGQNQMQTNLIKAQNFLYEADKPQAVIVGSSLSARIDESLLSDGFTNLAMSGMSLYDGLKVVLQKSALPASICIETNLITRGPSQDFENSLFSPVMYPLRDWIPGFREKNQPVGLTTGFILNKLKTAKAEGKMAPSVSDADKEKQDPVFAKVLQMAREDKETLPDTQLLAERVTALTGLVRQLEEKGVRIYFFEMPINKGLCDAAFPNHIREQMETHFPPSQYTYLPKPDCNSYNTTDGAHLDPLSAAKFTTWLKGQLDQIDQRATLTP